MTGIVLHEFRRVKELSQKNSWLRNYRVWFWYINDWRIRDIRYRVIHYMDRYKEDKGQGYLYKLLVTNEAIERSMDG